MRAPKPKTPGSVPSKAVKRGEKYRTPGQSVRQAQAQRKQDAREQVPPRRKVTPMPKGKGETTWTRKYKNDWVGRKTPKGTF